MAEQSIDAVWFERVSRALSGVEGSEADVTPFAGPTSRLGRDVATVALSFHEQPPCIRERSTLADGSVSDVTLSLGGRGVVAAYSDPREQPPSLYQGASWDRMHDIYKTAGAAGLLEPEEALQLQQA